MNRLMAVLSIFLTFALFSIPALGQQPQSGMTVSSDSMPGPMMGRMQGLMMHQGMMGMMRGMHQQMMQNPMHRSSMRLFMLPALADTLGLSDEQVSQLQELKNKAMSQRQEHRQQMMADRKEFMSLFQEGQPAPDRVRQHLTEMAQKRANQQAATYETAQQMRDVLNDEQRQMLDSLTPQQSMRHMMSHMPMMDMMKMMRSMHGSGMMGGGMMGSGMMGQGHMKNMPMQQNR